MTTTPTLTLTAFLEARIAEDEAVALQAVPGWNGPETIGIIEGHDTVMIDPGRVLAECKAKRRIVANTELAREACGSAPISEQIAASDGPAAAYWRGQDWVCRVLALPYAAHPDYAARWRPVP